MTERRRYVPVPRDALDLLHRGDWGAAVDLYQRGHTLRWKSFKFSDRSLATRWGCSRHRVWEILETLDDAELLKITRGAPRKKSSILVYDPNPKPGQYPGQNPGQKVDHKSEGSTPETDSGRPTLRPTPRPTPRPTLNDPDPYPDLDPEKKGALFELQPAASDDWKKLNAVYSSLPGCKAIRDKNKGLGLALSRMLSVHGLTGATQMLRWMAYAEGCPKAQSLEESGHRVLSTVGKVSHVEGYWPHVAKWVAGGCRGDPEHIEKPIRRKFVDPYLSQT